jgi:ubiquinone/menaquinone biosynthesis C-methylase UbiE
MQRHKEFFDEMAHRWDETVHHDPAKLELFFEAIQIKKGQTVLDVGTGTGVLIPYIYRYTGDKGKIRAIDLSSGMLQRAKEKYSFQNVEYIQGDVMDLSMEDYKHDAILCYSVFPHFLDQQATVSHLAKGLNHGGKLVICHSQSRDAINNLHRDAGENVKKDHLPPMDDIAAMMEQSGLKIKERIDNENMFFILGALI